MSNRGTYNVNENGSKHSSFKSFICALLVFLALCIILYCIILLVRLNKNSAKEDEFPKERDDYETFDRLTGTNNIPGKRKENTGYSTHGPITTDVDQSEETTVRLSNGDKGGIDGATINNNGEETTTAENTEEKIYSTGYLPDGIDKSYTKTKLSNTFGYTGTEPTVRDISTTDDYDIDFGVDHSIFHDSSSEDKKNAVEDERKTTDTSRLFYSVDSTEDVSNDSVEATTEDSQSTYLNSDRMSMNREEIFTTENFHSTSKSSDAMFQINEAETPAKYADTFETSTEINLSESSATENYIYKTTLETSQISTEINLSTNFVVSVSNPASFETTTNYPARITSYREKYVTVENSTVLSTIDTIREDKGTTENYINNIGGIGITSQDDTVKLCETANCHRTASKMLNLMNHAADPCVNFYEFACGEQESDDNFVKQSNLETLVNYLTEVDRKVLENFNLFYKSCVNYEQEFKFVERIKFMEYFPKNNLTDLFVDLILTESMPLFDVGLEISKDAQHYVLQITLPGKSSLRANVGGWSIMEQIRKECLNEQSYLTRRSDVNLREVYELLKNCQKIRFKTTAKNFINNMKPFFENYNDDIYNDKTH